MLLTLKMRYKAFGKDTTHTYRLGHRVGHRAYCDYVLGHHRVLVEGHRVHVRLGHRRASYHRHRGLNETKRCDVTKLEVEIEHHTSSTL